MQTLIDVRKSSFAPGSIALMMLLAIGYWLLAF
jgi:hypothetical protein